MEQTFFFLPEGRQVDVHQVHKNVVNITDHQGNVKQNHKEISSYTC